MSDSKSPRAASITDSDQKEEPEVSIQNVDPELERRALLKLDCTLLPVLLMFYIVFIDLTNYGNARVAGLQQDLKMTDAQFEVSFASTFLPYVAMQLPANLILRKIGPSIFMPTLLTLIGFMVVCQGLVTSFAGLVVVRILLGFIEGPILPAVVLYISGFYTRRELSVRIAFFFSVGGLAGTFSSLLAAAIETMDGIGGRPGWAWLFIIEGVFTIGMGLLAFIVVPSTPRDSRFLTNKEKDIIMARIERDRPTFTPPHSFTFREVLLTLASPHVVMFFIMQFMSGTISIGLAVFLPTLVSEMGHSRSKTQLMSAGPPAAGFFVTMITAFCSDRYNSRGIPIAIASGLSAIGFALYLAADNNHVAYGAMYIMVAANSIMPIMSSWMANNSEPYYRRATSIASGYIATALGSSLSIWLYPTKNGPKYRNTTILNMVFAILITVIALINMVYLSRRNKQKRAEGYRVTVLEKFKEDNNSDDDLKAWMELGDSHPDFKYTL